jgi:hypothetical protein
VRRHFYEPQKITHEIVERFAPSEGDADDTAPHETIFPPPRNRLETNEAYQWSCSNSGRLVMLSEKFILVLEALLKSQAVSYADWGPPVVSTPPHVPATLPAAK